jgi:hypothetical protein
VLVFCSSTEQLAGRGPWPPCLMISWLHSDDPDLSAILSPNMDQLTGRGIFRLLDPDDS